MRLPLVKGTKIAKDSKWSDSLPSNMVAFVQGADGDQYFMRSADGLKNFASSDLLGKDRGGIWSDRFGVHVRLSGNTLIEVDQFGGITDISGGLAIEGSSQAVFDNSFNTIAFVVNGEFYLYDPTAGTLTLITKPAGAGYFTSITQIDIYYILTDSESVWNTNPTDEYTIETLSYAGSEFAPDDIVACDKATDNKLMVFNRYSTERFYNAAGAFFPFTRIPNAAIPIGIVGPKAKVSLGDGAWAVFGGGKEYSPSFYILTNSYVKISTGEIDSILDTYSDYELTSISMEFRDVRDQRLVICHLPNHTLVYDATLSTVLGQPIWYTWSTDASTWRGINGVYDPRNVDNSASAWVYGDKIDGRLGKLDTSVCTQYGDAVEWSTATPLVVVGGTLAYMEVIQTPGHNVLDNPNRLFISTTRDGVLYGPEVPVSLGQNGEYQKRLIVLRLGDYPLWFGARFRGYSKTVVSLSAVDIDTKMP